MSYRRFAAAEKVVEHGDVMAHEHETIHKMRADETTSTCY